MSINIKAEPFPQYNDEYGSHFFFHNYLSQYLYIYICVCVCIFCFSNLTNLTLGGVIIFRF